MEREGEKNTEKKKNAWNYNPSMTQVRVITRWKKKARVTIRPPVKDTEKIAGEEQWVSQVIRLGEN